MVVLEVPNEEELLAYADLLSGWNGRPDPRYIRSFVLFYEPDIGDGEHTALATVSEGVEFADLLLAGTVMS